MGFERIRLLVIRYLLASGVTRSLFYFVYGKDDGMEGRMVVNHLERVASIVGALLIGVSAYLMASDRSARHGVRRRSEPVEKLEAELREAWAEYHNR